MKTEIKVHGLDELEKSLKELETATTSKILRQSLFWAAKPMFEAMRDSSPTGEDDERYRKRKIKLKRNFSLHSETRRWLSRASDSDGNSAQVNVGYRLKNAWYAGLLEYGTKYIKPIGWMRRSADNHWQEVVDRLGQRIQYRIKKLEKK